MDRNPNDSKKDGLLHSLASRRLRGGDNPTTARKLGLLHLLASRS